ncbi:hypothetical protein GCM10022381_29000 [Leifsonia kafniensis]|uniref:Uncharacterized protein n=1 Tax=Leifsonia kafniensis TaxID=475957 RepID=A0ABP7KST0_9MICO
MIAQAVPYAVVVDEGLGHLCRCEGTVRLGRRDLQRTNDDNRGAASGQAFHYLTTNPAIGHCEAGFTGLEPRPHRRIGKSVDTTRCTQLSQRQMRLTEQVDDNRLCRAYRWGGRGEVRQ